MDYMAGKKATVADPGDAELTESIRLRVSPADKQAFASAAKKDGRDLSGWLRHIARQAAGMAAS